MEFLYRENFKIGFDRISTVFASDLVVTPSPSDDIDQVLTQLNVKRISSPFTYDKNTKSIFHLISGRNYSLYNGGTRDSDVVGLAYLTAYPNNPSLNGLQPVLCSNFAIGTSQVSNKNINLTALIVAHEIGHNFGFDHDGESGTIAASCASDFVMAATLNGNFTEFSSCSQDALAPNIEAIANIESCFNYPVNLSIQDNNLPGSATMGPLVREYTVNLNQLTNAPSATVSVSGSISTGTGTLTQATLAGQNCTIDSGSRYTCELTNASSSSALSIGVTPAGACMELTHTASTGSAWSETITLDNTLTDSLQLAQSDLAPSILTADTNDTSINIIWCDSSDNETSFLVQRQDNNNWIDLATIAANSSQYVDNGLTSCTRYSYRVQANFPSSSATSNTFQVQTTGCNNSNSNSNSKSSGGGGGGSRW